MAISRATRRRLRAAVTYTALAVITLVMCFPLLWAVVTSVRPNDEMLEVRMLPRHVTAAHYRALLGGRSMYFEASDAGYRPTTAPSQHFLA